MEIESMYSNVWGERKEKKGKGIVKMDRGETKKKGITWRKAVSNRQRGAKVGHGKRNSWGRGLLKGKPGLGHKLGSVKKKKSVQKYAEQRTKKTKIHWAEKKKKKMQKEQRGVQ